MRGAAINRLEIFTSVDPFLDDPNEPAIARSDYFEDGVPAVDGGTTRLLKRRLSADKSVGQFRALVQGSGALFNCIL
jgi:hypothetical protein